MAHYYDIFEYVIDNWDIKGHIGSVFSDTGDMGLEFGNISVFQIIIFLMVQNGDPYCFQKDNEEEKNKLIDLLNKIVWKHCYIPFFEKKEVDNENIVRIPNSVILPYDGILKIYEKYLLSFPIEKIAMIEQEKEERIEKCIRCMYYMFYQSCSNHEILKGGDRHRNHQLMKKKYLWSVYDDQGKKDGNYRIDIPSIIRNIITRLIKQKRVIESNIPSEKNKNKKARRKRNTYPFHELIKETIGEDNYVLIPKNKAVAQIHSVEEYLMKLEVKIMERDVAVHSEGGRAHNNNHKYKGGVEDWIFCLYMDSLEIIMSNNLQFSKYVGEILSYYTLYLHNFKNDEQSIFNVLRRIYSIFLKIVDSPASKSLKPKFNNIFWLYDLRHFLVKKNKSKMFEKIVKLMKNELLRSIRDCKIRELISSSNDTMKMKSEDENQNNNNNNNSFFRQKMSKEEEESLNVRKYLGIPIDIQSIILDIIIIILSHENIDLPLSKEEEEEEEGEEDEEEEEVKEKKKMEHPLKVEVVYDGKHSLFHTFLIPLIEFTSKVNFFENYTEIPEICVLMQRSSDLLALLKDMISKNSPNCSIFLDFRDGPKNNVFKEVEEKLMKENNDIDFENIEKRALFADIFDDRNREKINSKETIDKCLQSLEDEIEKYHDDRINNRPTTSVKIPLYRTMSLFSYLSEQYPPEENFFFRDDGSRKRFTKTILRLICVTDFNLLESKHRIDLFRFFQSNFLKLKVDVEDANHFRNSIIRNMFSSSSSSSEVYPDFFIFHHFLPFLVQVTSLPGFCNSELLMAFLKWVEFKFLENDFFSSSSSTTKNDDDDDNNNNNTENEKVKEYDKKLNRRSFDSESCIVLAVTLFHESMSVKDKQMSRVPIFQFMYQTIQKIVSNNKQNFEVLLFFLAILKAIIVSFENSVELLGDHEVLKKVVDCVSNIFLHQVRSGLWKELSDRDMKSEVLGGGEGGGGRLYEGRKSSSYDKAFSKAFEKKEFADDDNMRKSMERLLEILSLLCEKKNVPRTVNYDLVLELLEFMTSGTKVKDEHSLIINILVDIIRGNPQIVYSPPSVFFPEFDDEEEEEERKRSRIEHLLERLSLLQINFFDISVLGRGNLLQKDEEEGEQKKKKKSVGIREIYSGGYFDKSEEIICSVLDMYYSKGGEEEVKALIGLKHFKNVVWVDHFVSRKKKKKKKKRKTKISFMDEEEEGEEDNNNVEFILFPRVREKLEKWGIKVSEIGKKSEEREEERRRKKRSKSNDEVSSSDPLLTVFSMPDGGQYGNLEFSFLEKKKKKEEDQEEETTETSSTKRLEDYDFSGGRTNNVGDGDGKEEEGEVEKEEEENPFSFQPFDFEAGSSSSETTMGFDQLPQSQQPKEDGKETEVVVDTNNSDSIFGDLSFDFLSDGKGNNSVLEDKKEEEEEEAPQRNEEIKGENVEKEDNKNKDIFYF